MTQNTKLHLAIVPDGNRRWARAKLLMPWQGHEKAMDVFSNIIDWCEKNERIGTLTLWCFSTENWKRDKAEIDKLMGLLETYLQKKRPMFREKQVRLTHTGRKDRLPKSIIDLLSDIEEETKNFSKLTLNLAIDHGGKDEVVRAMKKFMMHAAVPSREVTDEAIREHLDHPELPDIDLVIRTSGEYRTSNFAIWQAAYAEWMFVTKHFPELTPTDLDAAIAEFDSRKRRYGG